MPNNPIPVQLAFQGGGAKLAVLLAAAEAVQTLQKQGALHVTRIAGTSAGAIIGSLLAIGADLSRVRIELAGPGGQDLLKAHPLPSLPVIIAKAAFGTPFWSDAALKKWLYEHFKAIETKNKEPLRFLHLARHGRPELVVVSTNLSTGNRHEFSQDSDVLGAVLSSAALPFCFRTWKSGGQEMFVDGGICKNLPVESLLKHQDQSGPVVAFSFGQARESLPDGALSFALALLSAAINDSVESSRQQLAPYSVCVLGQEAPEVTTFAFAEALAFLASQRYDDARQGVQQWFESMIAREQRRQVLLVKGVVTEDLWRRPEFDEGRRQMAAIGRIYQRAHLPVKFKYHHLQVVVTTHSLLPKTHPLHRNHDEVRYEFEFEPGAKPLGAHHLTLSNSDGEQFFDDYTLEFWGVNNTAAKIESVAAAVPDSGSLRELVTFFTPPLEPGTGRYGLRLTDQGVGLMAQFSDAGNPVEEIQLQLGRAEGTVGLVEIFLRIPTGFPPVTVEDSNVGTLNHLNKSAVAKRIGEVDGFRTYGWACENFPAQPTIKLILRA